MTHISLYTETSGLDATRHQVWEIAYAIDDEPVRSALVPHNVVRADKVALEVGQYYERGGYQYFGWDCHFEWELIGDFEDHAPATLVGANPAFDAAMLKARWAGRVGAERTRRGPGARNTRRCQSSPRCGDAEGSVGTSPTVALTPPRHRGVRHGCARLRQAAVAQDGGRRPPRDRLHHHRV